MMDDLSSPSNPIVLIVLLVALCIAGLNISRHRGHFFGEPPFESIEQNLR